MCPLPLSVQVWKWKEATLIKGKLGRGTLAIPRVPLPLFVLIRAIRFQPLRELKPYHLAKNTHPV